MTADELRIADERLRSFDGKAVKSACYAPFVSLYLNPTGTVLACCRNESFLLGNVRTQRLAEIWNGGRIKALRKALTDYKFNLGCAFCEWEAQRRSDSFAIRLMSDQFPVLSPEPEWPALIEFNGSNTCNLECMMCGGEYSSSIRANREGLPPLPRVYTDQFFADLRVFLPHLRFINFLGGEPFITREVHCIWEMMMEDGLKIPCRVTTNGTQYNGRIERVLASIPMNITVSLDGATKTTFENIRRRANFDTVIANLHRFHAYTQDQGTKFGIAFCLMRENWHELGDIVLLAEELDCELSINMVIDPSHCSLFTLPNREFQSVREGIESQGLALVSRLRRHRKAWEETVSHLRAAGESAQVKRIGTVLVTRLQIHDALARARRTYEEGDYAKALRILSDIREDDATYYEALTFAGQVRTSAGDLAGAEMDLSRALKLTQKLPDAYLQLARLRFRQGRVADALENALQAKQRVTPEHQTEAQLLLLLGFIYCSQWRLAEALRVFARLLILPAPVRHGARLPESLGTALQNVAELKNDAPSFRARLLAFQAYTVYRLALQWQRFSEYLRNSPLTRRGTRSQMPRTLSVGKAAEQLAAMRDKRRSHWTLRVAGANAARLQFPAKNPEIVRVEIDHMADGADYDVQLNYSHLRFTAQRVYLVKLRVRADGARTIGLGLAQAHAPWANIGLYRVLQVDAGWVEVAEEFVSPVEEDNGRVHFDLGGSTVAVEIACIAVTELPNPPAR